MSSSRQLGMQAERQSGEPTCRGRVDGGENNGPTAPRSQRWMMDPEEESGDQISQSRLCTLSSMGTDRQPFTHRGLPCACHSLTVRLWEMFNFWI